MVIKFVTMILGSIAINAYATPQEMVKCARGHADFVASAPKGFEVKQTKNEAVGIEVTSVIAPDGSSMTIMTAPLSVMDKFKDFPLKPLGVQCLGPKGELFEAFALYGPPKPVLGGPNSI
jgi:hypothetical protein